MFLNACLNKTRSQGMIISLLYFSVFFVFNVLKQFVIDHVEVCNLFVKIKEKRKNLKKKKSCANVDILFVPKLYD